MNVSGTWVPYSGSGALLLAVVLFVITGSLAYFGTRLHRPLGVERPGRAVSVLLVVIWFLSLGLLWFLISCQPTLHHA